MVTVADRAESMIAKHEEHARAAASQGAEVIGFQEDLQYPRQDSNRHLRLGRALHSRATRAYGSPARRLGGKRAGGAAWGQCP